MRRRLGRRRRARRAGRLRRHQGVRGRRAPVAAPAHARRATPSCTRRSAIPPTRWAPSWPAAGRCRCRRRALPASTCRSIDPADAARALCLWVNTPGNPAGGLDDLARRRPWGRAPDVPVFSDECYVEFTWDGPPRTILEHGTDGRGRRPLAVQAVQPGRSPGRLLRRRPRAGRLPARGAQARRLHGRRVRCRPRRWPRGPTTPTSTSSGSATGAGSSGWPSILGDWGVDAALPGGGVLPVGAGPGRRRLGARRAAGRRGRGGGQPGRVLRAGRRRPRPPGHGAARRPRSSWSPPASAWPDRTGRCTDSRQRRRPGSQWLGDDGVGSLVGRAVRRPAPHGPHRRPGQPPAVDRRCLDRRGHPGGRPDRRRHLVLHRHPRDHPGGSTTCPASRSRARPP